WLALTLVGTLALLMFSVAALLSAPTVAGQDDDPAATDAPDADAPREIEHAAGVTIIESIPERVVVLEWTYAEDLLALGIQPVGVADVAGYEAWVNVEPELGDDVVDVG